MKTVIHILLIEDNPGDARLLEEYLKHARLIEVNMLRAARLSQGIEMMADEENRIDLVLLDLDLPDCSGIDTFLNLHQRFPDTPIIVLTGANEDELGLKAIQSGAQDFLFKNDLMDELVKGKKGRLLERSISYAFERNQLKLRLKQAQQLAKVGHWEINVHNNLLSCSPEIYRIFEQDDNRKLRTLEDYIQSIHPDDQEKVVLCFIQAFKDGGTFEVEHKIPFPDGRVKYAIIQGKAQKDRLGNYTSLIGTTQDISERKAMEQLAIEKDLAEQSAKLKQDFLAKTSHEIRTPLNPILLLTNILLNTQPTPQQREHLNAIKTAGETLLAVVNDVLDLSKIEAGKIDFHHNVFNLSQVFSALREMMELNAREKSLDLIFDLDPELPRYIIGDNVRLTQILLNLIGNAIKFTHKGYIRVEGRAKIREADRVRIEFCVSDTGIGIPSHQLVNIFESFNQVNQSIGRRYNGTGLGLTIVKQLVKLQGGDIFVSSSVGQGSVFTFELDFGISEEESTQYPEAEELDKDSLKGLEVLLVEDNPLNQLVTKKIVSAWGANIDIANNGKECLDVLEHKSYDLILMDLQMPEMDGYEATQRIRSQMAAPARDTPIIAITANAFTGMDDTCLKVGMNDYISKPFEPGHLYSKIVQHARQNYKWRTHAPQPAVKAGVVNGKHTAEPDNTDHSINEIPASMGTPPYTDLTYLKGISMGDDTIVRKAIDRYLKDTPELLDQMQQHLDEHNYDALGKCAHKLKSSVGIMGMDRLKETMQRIVNICRNDLDKEQLPGIFNAARQVVLASVEELSAALKNL